MAKSEVTKKYRKLGILFSLLSFLLLVGPTFYYVGVGFMTTGVVVQKLALVSAVLVSGILTGICAINKVAFRSKIWIIVLALFFVIDHFLVMIFVFGGTQILDELVVAPLAKYFRSKASINAEIDKRVG